MFPEYNLLFFLPSPCPWKGNEVTKEAVCSNDVWEQLILKFITQVIINTQFTVKTSTKIQPFLTVMILAYITIRGHHLWKHHLLCSLPIFSVGLYTYFFYHFSWHFCLSVFSQIAFSMFLQMLFCNTKVYDKSYWWHF